MKAKLINTNVNYLLEDDKGVIIASTSTKEGNNKLSKQNCDEIFGVVDVDKLADILNDISIDLADYQNEAGKGMSTNEEWKDLFIERVTASITSYETSERPTEVEVEIEMEEIQEIYRDGTVKYERCPKLDSEGCLILKRIV